MAFEGVEYVIKGRDEARAAFESAVKSAKGMERGVQDLKKAFQFVLGLKAAEAIGDIAAKALHSATALAAAQREGRNFGNQLSALDLRAIDSAETSFLRVQQSIQFVSAELIAGAAPAFKALADVVQEAVGDGEKLRETGRKIAESLVEAGEFGAKAFTGLSAGVDLVQAGFDKLVSWVFRAGEAIGKIGTVIPGLSEGAGEFANEMGRAADEAARAARANVDQAVGQLGTFQKIEETTGKIVENIRSQRPALEESAGVSEKMLAEARKAAEEGLKKDIEGILTVFNSGMDAIQARMEQANKENEAALAFAVRGSTVDQELLLEQEKDRLLLEEKAAFLEESWFLSQADSERMRALESQDVEFHLQLEAKRQQALRTMQASFQNLAFALMQSGSKKGFEIGKALAIGMTVVDTISGAMGAWRAAQVLPFPLNMIVGGSTAAAITATGALRIAQLKSQKFGGSGTLSNPTVTTGVPGAFPSSSGSTEGAALPGQGASGERSVPREITLLLPRDDRPVSTAWIRDNLIPQLNEAAGDGVTIRSR